MTRRRTPTYALVAALAAVPLAACSVTTVTVGGSPTPATAGSPSAPATVEVPTCMPAGTTAQMRGPAEDPTLVVLVGTGDKGVVLAPQLGEDYCLWAGEAERLVGAGYRVASFWWAEDGRSSVQAAVDVLHEAGVTRLVLMGASKGGTYSAAMAGVVTPPPLGVIAIGPPSQIENVSAEAKDLTYTGPLLVVVAKDDSAVSADDSRRLVGAGRPGARFEVLAGSAHGVALIDAHPEEMHALIDGALAAAFRG